MGTFLHVVHTFPFEILCLPQVIEIMPVAAVLKCLEELDAISDGMLLQWHCSQTELSFQ